MPVPPASSRFFAVCAQRAADSRVPRPRSLLHLQPDIRTVGALGGLGFHLFACQTLTGEHGLQDGDVCGDVHGVRAEEAVQLLLEGGDDGAHDVLHLLLGAGDVLPGDPRASPVILGFRAAIPIWIRSREQ